MHTNVDQINIKMDRVIDLLSHMAQGGCNRKPMSPKAMVEIKKASELMPDQSVVTVPSVEITSSFANAYQQAVNGYIIRVLVDARTRKWAVAHYDKAAARLRWDNGQVVEACDFVMFGAWEVVDSSNHVNQNA